MVSWAVRTASVRPHRRIFSGGFCASGTSSHALVWALADAPAESRIKIATIVVGPARFREGTRAVGVSRAKGFVRFESAAFCIDSILFTFSLRPHYRSPSTGTQSALHRDESGVTVTSESFHRRSRKS